MTDGDMKENVIGCIFSEHSVEGITEPVSDRGEGDRKRVYNTENKLQISQE